MRFDARILTGVGVLAAVVEAGNFARAGEALGLTPSGVSRAVARLEVRVGIRLFDRTPRSAMLTGADVAVRFGPVDGASLVARKILETRVLTCAAPAYLERRGMPATPHDLVDHETILFRDPQTGLPFTWGF